MKGLSAKSVVVSFICQLVIFLYLLDNETSWMILGSAGIGCCIEFWKIGKAMHIEVCGFLGVQFLFCPFFCMLVSNLEHCAIVVGRSIQRFSYPQVQGSGVIRRQ